MKTSSSSSSPRAPSRPAGALGESCLALPVHPDTARVGHCTHRGAVHERMWWCVPCCAFGLAGPGRELRWVLGTRGLGKEGVPQSLYAGPSHQNAACPHTYIHAPATELIDRQRTSSAASRLAGSNVRRRLSRSSPAAVIGTPWKRADSLLYGCASNRNCVYPRKWVARAHTHMDARAVFRNGRCIAPRVCTRSPPTSCTPSTHGGCRAIRDHAYVLGVGKVGVARPDCLAGRAQQVEDALQLQHTHAGHARSAASDASARHTHTHTNIRTHAHGTASGGRSRVPLQSVRPCSSLSNYVSIFPSQSAHACVWQRVGDHRGVPDRSRPCRVAAAP
jgi:hypothetical protein